MHRLAPRADYPIPRSPHHSVCKKKIRKSRFSSAPIRVSCNSVRLLYPTGAGACVGGGLSAPTVGRGWCFLLLLLASARHWLRQSGGGGVRLSGEDGNRRPGGLLSRRRLALLALSPQPTSLVNLKNTRRRTGPSTAREPSTRHHTDLSTRRQTGAGPSLVQRNRGCRLQLLAHLLHKWGYRSQFMASRLVSRWCHHLGGLVRCTKSRRR